MAYAGGFAKTKYAVICLQHGIERRKGGAKAEVMVAQPKTKKQRTAGCPICNKLK